MYQLTKVAIANYHNLGGLKQWKLILSQFPRLEVRNQGVIASWPFG